MQAASSPRFKFRPVVAPATLVTTAAGLMFALTVAAAEPRSRNQCSASANPPASLENLRARDQELESVSGEQKKAIENEAKLKREIEAIGDDRRKFNQQIIDTAARVVSLEEQIAKTKERMTALDDSEQALRNSLEQRRD